MAVQGNIRTTTFEGKKIGLFNSKPIIVNPNREEYKEVLGIDLKEDSKVLDYLGESEDGNTTLKVNIWVQDVKTGFKQPINFFLENKVRVNKTGEKTQYINSTGTTSWADQEENLPDWFKRGEYRPAYVGEDDLCKYLRMVFNKIDYKQEGAALSVNWKQLMKGNVKELREDLASSIASEVGVMAIVKTVDKDGETKEYQGIYNKEFLPDYSLKNFRLVDYSNLEVIETIRKKQPKDRKPHEKFVLAVSDNEHGCKDAYSFKDLHDFDASTYLPATNKVISEEGSDY